MAWIADLSFRHHKPFALGRLALPSKSRGAPGDLAGGIAAGTAGLAIGGLALYFLKERGQEEAEHEVLEQDGAFSLRRYAKLVTAEVRRYGTLAAAMDHGFRPLFDYIAARKDARRPDASRRKIAMTVPVSVAPAPGAARSGSWTVRFVMPRAWSLESLPEPANGVILSELAPRTVAAVRFPGRARDERLIARKRKELTDWVEKRGLIVLSEPEFAAYNAPIVPGRLRRNEWWIPVEDL